MTLRKPSQYKKLAKENGVDKNVLFLNNLEVYKTQYEILENLKKAIEEDGLTVTKEYVKGRENVYTSPAVKEYNNTANALNRTATTLINIIKTFKKEDASKADELEEFIKNC